MDKKEIRKLSLERRRRLPLSQQRQFSEQITQRVEELDLYKQAHTIMVYVSMRSEVHTHTLIQRMFKDKRVIVPKVENDELLLCEISSFDDLAPGYFKILEPREPKIVDPSEIELILVPLAAFDPGCNRIGYGRGHYDRLLEKTNCPTIGFAYEEQKVHSIPAEPHDKVLDSILTEKTLYSS